MADPNATFPKTPSSLGTIGRLVTPGEIDLDPVPKAVTCLTGGDLTIVPVGNASADALSYVGVSAGFMPPYRVRRVISATATVATVEG